MTRGFSEDRILFLVSSTIIAGLAWLFSDLDVALLFSEFGEYEIGYAGGNPHIAKPFSHILFFSNLTYSVFFLYVLTSLVGYWGVLRPLNLKKPLALQILASFAIGFPIVIAVARLLGLFAYRKHIYWVVVAVLLLGVGITFFKSQPWKAWKKRLSGEGVAKSFFWFILGVLALVFFGVMTLQFGYHPFVGHGNNYSMILTQDVFEFAQDAPFPVSNHNYGEILYQYIYDQFRPQEALPIIFSWVNRSVLKASTLFLSFLVLSSLNLGKTLSVAGSLFLLIGTLSIEPAKYVYISDGYNPILVQPTIGRIFVVILPLLLLLSNLKSKLSKELIVSLILFYIGLTAFTPNIFAFYMIALIIFMGLRLMGKAWAPLSMKTMTVPLSLGFFFMIVGFDQPEVFRGIPLVLSGFIFGFLVLFYASRDFSYRFEKEYLLSTCFGMTFLGGPLAFLIWQKYQRYFEIYIPSIVEMKSERFVETLMWFKYVGCPHEVTNYCMGPMEYLSHFAFTIILGGIGLYVAISTKRRNAVSWILIGFGGLAFSLFLVDFIDFNQTGKPFIEWFKSRVLEVPVYLVILGAIWSLGKERLRYSWTYFLISVVFVVWSILPFLLTDLHKQWIRNFLFLKESLIG